MLPSKHCHPERRFWPRRTYATGRRVDKSFASLRMTDLFQPMFVRHRHRRSNSAIFKQEPITVYAALENILCLHHDEPVQNTLYRASQTISSLEGGNTKWALDPASPRTTNSIASHTLNASRIYTTRSSAKSKSKAGCESRRLL